jgi:hypothetical protein
MVGAIVARRDMQRAKRYRLLTVVGATVFKERYATSKTGTGSG